MRAHLREIARNDVTRTVTVASTCPMCKTTSHVEVGQQAFADWDMGALIQVAMPRLTDDERERLITGICDTCWRELAGDDEDDWDDEDDL